MGDGSNLGVRRRGVPSAILFAALLCIASLPAWVLAAEGDITTVAGTTVGLSGDGGPATAAQLSEPIGVAPTADGGYLIADADNHRIRKVSAAGIISTVAGTTQGLSGDGGPATAAQLYVPIGVAPTADGGFLIADTGNHRIRMVSAAGIISTVAGTTQGLSGDNGPATSAQLNQPNAVALTADGGYLIADFGNHRIRKVSAAGNISTVAGTTQGLSGDGGPATAAQLSQPADAAPTADGGYLIADSNNHRIRKVSAAGTISTVAGTTQGLSGDGGPATAAQLFGPAGVAPTAAGGYLIADSNNHRIRHVEGPSAVPSNAFSFGKLKRNKRRGTATLTVNVPGPGTLTLTGKGLKKQRPAALASKVVPAAGKVKLKVKSKGRKKRKLNETGKVRVKAKVTYTPTGGTPNTKTKKIKLVKHL